MVMVFVHPDDGLHIQSATLAIKRNADFSFVN